jgi:hypothetical protein
VFQIIKTIRYIVFDGFGLAHRTPTENLKVPLAQPIQLVLEQIICQFRASGHNLTKTNPIPYNKSFFLPIRPLGHHWTFVQKTDRPFSTSPSLRRH